MYSTRWVGKPLENCYIVRNYLKTVRTLHQVSEICISQTYRIDMKVYPSTSSNIGIGDVSRVISSDIDVNATICCTVNFDTGKVCCPCKFYEEHFQPCSDSIKVILACGKDPNDILFFGTVNTTAKYIEQYSSVPISFGNIVLKPAQAKQLDPKHAFSKKRGRPSKNNKKRIERQSLGLGVRLCPGCGMKGHFLSSCKQLNLGMAAYRREQNIKTTLKKMCSDTIEVNDTSCLIVSHDTQNEEAVPTDDLVYEYLDYND